MKYFLLLHPGFAVLMSLVVGLTIVLTTLIVFDTVETVVRLWASTYVEEEKDDA